MRIARANASKAKAAENAEHFWKSAERFRKNAHRFPENKPFFYL